MPHQPARSRQCLGQASRVPGNTGQHVPAGYNAKVELIKDIQRPAHLKTVIDKRGCEENNELLRQARASIHGGAINVHKKLQMFFTPSFTQQSSDTRLSQSYSHKVSRGMSEFYGRK
ncbi:hypothetical protein Ct61P_14528 [Colletotrichum tofieldiae]|nr:hypothetical protein Ct61P_14528 [Colletotrichum tofieldiae]